MSICVFSKEKVIYRADHRFLFEGFERLSSAGWGGGGGGTELCCVLFFFFLLGETNKKMPKNEYLFCTVALLVGGFSCLYGVHFFP